VIVKSITLFSFFVCFVHDFIINIFNASAKKVALNAANVRRLVYHVRLCVIAMVHVENEIQSDTIATVDFLG